MARTTLVIPDALWREVKLRAAKENKTISDWVAEAVQSRIKPAGKRTPPGYKFDAAWFAKPGGKDLPFPLTREHIYGPVTDDPRTWR
ncbi:hypothetical protein HY522_05110 [bacterium]|nr:hypothetical protein [bacterium]